MEEKPKQTIEGAPKARQEQNAQEAHDAEMRRLELEAAKLELKHKAEELEFKTLQRQELRDQIDERQMKRDSKFDRAKANGATLRSLARNDKIVQARCNHKKGGDGAEGVVGGRGDDNQYAVLKHAFANGDKWVSCLRCHKTWKPPYREDYETEAGYEGAIAEYKVALDFTTRNHDSGSVAFQWGDGGAFYRQALKNSTLR